VAELTEVRADDLAALDIFEGCQAPDLEPLAAQLRPLVAVPGEVLMRQGERAVWYLAILFGRRPSRQQ
jgi:hypothetical protein